MTIFLENILDEAEMWLGKCSELHGMCDDKFVFNEAFYTQKNLLYLFGNLFICPN